MTTQGEHGPEALHVGASGNRIVRRVRVVEDANGQWHVRAVGGNNEVVLTSEQYGSRGWAMQVAADLGLPVDVVERRGKGDRGSTARQ
jgi:hypothetical protein